ncbi:MAG: PH domain-containing protein [Patescibacteria group bacterium]
MNPQSIPLQAQFPLQKNTKFWKKFISNLVPILLGGIALGGGVFAILALNNEQMASSSNGIALVLAATVIIALLYIWYLTAYIREYYYSADQNFITIKKGVLAPSEIHVQYQKIQDVYVDQDILDRILGIYDVHIASATASSGIEAHIDGVSKEAAEGLKNFFLSSIQNGSAALASNEPAAPAPAVFTSSAELSSKVYPLSSTWFAVTLISRILWSVAIVIFYAFLFSSSDGSADGGVLAYFGIYALLFIWNIVSLILWRNNYAFDFKEHFIYYKEGVISIQEKHMPYASIQDVSVSQNFVERLFGFAKVVIMDATQSGMAVSRGFGRGTANTTNPSGISLQGLKRADADHIADIIKTTILNRKQQSANGL